MNCNELKDLLPFLDDGSLNESIERDAHDHLEQCDECMHEYQDLGRTLSIVKSALSQPSARSTDDFLADVRQTIQRRKRHRMITYRILPVAAVFMAALTISFYSLLMHRTISPAQNMFAFTTVESDYSSYVAEYYLDVYEVYELTEEDNSAEMYDTFDELIESGYVNIDIPDIIDVIDEETAALWFE